MKRISIIALAGVAAAVCLLAPSALADAPSPAPKPKPVPFHPVCTIAKGVAVPTGVTTVGICRDQHGNKVWGAQLSYKNLKVSGLSATACNVAKTFGSAGTTGRIAIPYKGVTATYTVTIWVAKNSKHLASIRTDPRSTRTLTVQIPGKQALCAGNPPVVAPEGPNSSMGSGNGGDAQTGFNCGWAGGLSVDQHGIHIPGMDCSGNGSCAWKSEGNTFVLFGYTFYASRVECSNGVLGIPIFNVTVSYPDGSSCKLVPLSDTSMFPLPPSSWYGDLSVEVILVTGARRSTRDGLPQVLIAGPIHGTGTTRLC